MKRVFITILIVILSLEPIVCFASPSDPLAISINEIVKNKEELSVLCKIYGQDITKLKGKTVAELANLFNREIRHSYGHTVANLFRNDYEPEYAQILVDTLEHLKLWKESDGSITYAEAEELIFIHLMEETKQRIIKEKGIKAWKQISHKMDIQAKKMLKQGKITQSEYGQFTKGFLALEMTSGMVLANMSGIVIYQLGTSLFWTCVNALGLNVAMTVGTPLATHIVGTAIGPIGWIAVGVIDIYLLGSTNWDKTVAAMCLVSAHNMQRRYSPK